MFLWERWNQNKQPPEINSTWWFSSVIELPQIHIGAPQNSWNILATFRCKCSIVPHFSCWDCTQQHLNVPAIPEPWWSVFQSLHNLWWVQDTWDCMLAPQHWHNHVKLQKWCQWHPDQATNPTPITTSLCQSPTNTSTMIVTPGHLHIDLHDKVPTPHHCHQFPAQVAKVHKTQTGSNNRLSSKSANLH
jgi:hypothetical protein